MTGPEEAGQRHRNRDEPADHPGGQDPRRGSREQGAQARTGDGQPDEARPERPDGHPPVSVGPQLRWFVHAAIVPGDTVEGPESLVPGPASPD